MAEERKNERLEEIRKAIEFWRERYGEFGEMIAARLCSIYLEGSLSDEEKEILMKESKHLAKDFKIKQKLGEKFFKKGTSIIPTPFSGIPLELIEFEAYDENWIKIKKGNVSVERVCEDCNYVAYEGSEIVGVFKNAIEFDKFMRENYGERGAELSGLLCWFFYEHLSDEEIKWLKQENQMFWLKWEEMKS